MIKYKSGNTKLSLHIFLHGKVIVHFLRNLHTINRIPVQTEETHVPNACLEGVEPVPAVLRNKKFNHIFMFFYNFFKNLNILFMYYTVTLF